MDGMGDEFEMRCKLCGLTIKTVNTADRFCCEGCWAIYERLRSGYVVDAAVEGLDLRSLASSEDGEQ
jgi:hypothetical protein